MRHSIPYRPLGAARTLALFALAWICGGPIASGQGTAFTYQGWLAEHDSPASGIYDLRFAIYDLANGGSVVAGPRTNSAVTVSNGLFTVTLDFGTGVFTGADRWLEIGVRAYDGSAFTILSPRQPLTSTPYAIRAANFSGPVATSQLIGTISPNNIGTGSITRIMLAAGAVGSAQLGAGAVTTSALADGAVTAAKVFSVSNWIALTITNPTPLQADLFGRGVAAVGTERIVIGAPNAAAVYVYSVHGELLTTITNPTPYFGGFFGHKVAAVGSDRVLAGAQFESSTTMGGAAYLFNINGTLFTTFTNPTPASGDEFGSAVAAVGSDRVLIGASEDDAGATNAGAAYLFSTSGALLTTFTNPAPAIGGQFGISAAALGSDRVLIGTRHDDTDAGVAYLFSTDGTLLTTFTNPTPVADDNFGFAVAAVGENRVLIGAFLADRGGLANAGAAYLFSTNGTLLTTFNKPTPAGGDAFGTSVAGMADDRVLIGATGDDAGGFNAGAAYVFSVGGALLATLTNPTPAANDNFGFAAASVGSDRVLIGAFADNAGAPGAGAAHLFTFESFTPGLVAAGVRPGAVTSASIAAGAVTSESIASGAVTADKVATVSNTFVVTIANPTPAAFDNFGASVAGVGTDRLLVGAYLDNAGAVAAGAAYLFSTSGSLLTVFTNPTPAAGENFGISVAAMGTDRVLIGAQFGDGGAPDVGAAYLFSVNGALLTTFTNPTPASADHFGFGVAAVGTDRVLIGAYQDDTGAGDAGAAYLFRTNGTLLTTFTNPAPALFDHFGNSVAAVGTDRVLIGAWKDDTGATDAGAAYLFSTSGTLLTTFTNPAPASNEHFGFSVTAVGSDRVLIGAFGDANNAGAAHLFSTSGALLTTFTNPTPAAGDFFGSSVAAVGTDRVLIGAYQDDTSAGDAGAAYLFSTNGALLTTFTSPAPAANEFFGYSVAAVGTDRALIGAFRDGTSGGNAGSAFLFGIEAFTPGLIADGVNAGSITAASLEDGAVTISKLDPLIGVWTRTGESVYRPAGNVGIGTATPNTSLHIAADEPVMVLQDTGPAATQSGYLGFWNNTATETAWVGFGSPGSPHFSVVNGRSGGNIALLPVSGNVGIGTTSPQTTLQVSGNNSQLRLHDSVRGNFWHLYTENHGNPAIAGNLLFVPGPGGVFGFIQKTTGNYFSSSDARLKEEVRDLNGVLDRVLRLRPVSYRFKSAPKEAPRTLGLIAQDVEPLFPEVVGEQSGMKSLAYTELVPVTVGAIQELNEKLEKKLQQKETEIAELKARLETLEHRVNQKHGGGQ